MNFKKYKLKDLVDNFSVRARDYGGSDGLEFLGVSNDDGIVKSKSAAEHKGEEYKIIEKGCFAYNPYRINIGSIAYHNEEIKGLISPAYVIFKTKPNSIKDNLLFKFLKSAEGLRQIRFHGRGTVRQALRFEDLCKIEISLPSYEEQELLISNIENTELESNLISSELTHQLDLIKQLRQAFLREAMQGKLVKSTNTAATGQQLLDKIKAEKAQLIAEKKLKKEKELPPITEDEIPFEIPENWAWCRLGEICNYGSSPKAEPKDINEDTWVLDLEDIEKETSVLLNKIRFIERNSLSTKSVFKKGEVLYSKLRPYLDKVIVADEGGVCTTEILPLKLYANINPYFVKYALKRSDFLTYVNSVTKGMKMPRLGTNDGQMALFPLPPLDEQEEIVAKLEELMAFCDGLEQSIKESQWYNEKLLQQVLREALQG